MRRQVIFVTSHAKKAEQVSLHLNYPVRHKKLDLPEIQSLNPIEVVTHKAKEAYKQLKEPVLVEDISVRFDAIGGLPGTLIKWFLLVLGPNGLCRLLNGYKDRTACIEPFFALYDGRKMQIFSASIKGEIAKEPRGNNDFGMDSIFIPTGHSKTWGEMSKEEQAKTSVRKIALKKLQDYLQSS